jgi:alanyl-tRNA synthetase
MTNNSSINPSYKVIADHLRSSAFLIADGVMPAGEGRGYVLRRIMRRAMRHIHKLHSGGPAMYKLVPSLVAQMGQAYPELVRAQDLIIDTLKTEEERFGVTLNRGMEILEKEIARIESLRKIGGKDYLKAWEGIDGTFSDLPMDGVVAFKLYDTYGFPLDLTQDILREKNIEVDVSGFVKEMEVQKKRAKENWGGSGEEKDSDLYFKLKEKLPKIEFTGYKTTKSSAKILVILKDGKEILEAKTGDKNIEIILDKTPFYATSGGQRGDDGNLVLENEYQEGKLLEYTKLKNILDVFETKKIAGDLLIHFISEIRGSFKTGDKIVALVNNRNRQFRAQNHSATHLLHFALKQVLGSQITQKGSNVDSHYLTFDFNHNKPVSLEELWQIEDLVNFYIRQDSQIKTEILPISEARDKGAVALFGEKYDNVVRVLQMGNSIELCGGTHANSTGNIGIFKIISEKGIAAGIRRIEARTGFFALEYSRLQEQKLQALLEALKVKQQLGEVNLPENGFQSAKKGFNDLCYFKNEETGNIVVSKAEVESIKNLAGQIYSLGEAKMLEIKSLQKEIDNLKKEKLFANNNFKSEKLGEINFIYHFFEGVNTKDLRDLATSTKNQKEYQQNSIILFFSSFEDKISTILSVSSNLTDKIQANKIIPQIAEKLGGKGGGGKPDLAMCGGVNKNGINEAIGLLKSVL